MDDTKPQAPVAPVEPAIASPSGEPQVATDKKPDEEMVTVTRKEWERKVANAGRASAAEKARLLAEEKVKHFADGGIDDEDPEKKALKEQNEQLQEQLILNEVSRAVEAKLVDSDLSEEAKKLIRENPILLADKDDLITRNAKIIRLSIEQKIDELEEVAAKAKETKPAPAAPEFTPGVAGTPPAPAASPYEEAKKKRDFTSMIHSIITGKR